MTSKGFRHFLFSFLHFTFFEQISKFDCYSLVLEILSIVFKHFMHHFSKKHAIHMLKVSLLHCLFFFWIKTCIDIRAHSDVTLCFKHKERGNCLRTDNLQRENRNKNEWQLPKRGGQYKLIVDWGLLKIKRWT